VGPGHAGRPRLTGAHPDPADIVIVGAGAAGLAAAVFAKQLAPARSVMLLDGAARPGAKILVSGGSRCNVTNETVTERDFNGGRPAIVRRILRRLPVADTVAFFQSIGVALHREEGGKLFPDSNRARDVLDALLRASARAGVELRASTRVTAVHRRDAGFTIETAQGAITARRVVLATGGQSLPKTGSDGAGYAFARALGHTIVPTTPALVPLVLGGGAAIHTELSGISHEVELALRIDGAIALRRRGSLLWTHFGISGPVVLDMSRHVLRARLEGKDTALTVNLPGGEAFEILEQRWTALARERPRAAVATVLADMLPAAVAHAVLDRLGIDRALVLAHFQRDARRRLVHALSEWPLNVSGDRGYNYAEATAGGVALGEIDPATMESRQCPDLYLIGEILDVDGRIGGFNFQWAWSSARVAAEAVAHA
jgi:predicted Rossmann fold flavoprotein